ncbi:MAG: type IIL restriction-modification enzyme MmeI [Gammaproteobacteria bacterium]
MRAGSESRARAPGHNRWSWARQQTQTEALASQRAALPAWDSAMLRARAQTEAYARALPAAEGRPPFVVVVDVGHSIELYSEFSQSGGAYVPFPDPRNHRILLTDLRNETHRDTLRQVWLTPLALDPARRAARVTREIAAKLARLAQSLERAGHAPDQVAAFLMRCLFTLFAEDVGLLGKNSFTELLNSLRDAPQHFPHLARELWQAMNHGGFSTAIRAEVLRFNGGLFADPTALALSREQLELLIEAARADWRQVEPAIFGTLLERALNPVERHKLGAHYTPRAYVERLVTPTVIEPLRAEWQAAQAAALTLDRQGKRKDAVQQLRDFHRRLCQVRVLDPACGSGNFLYVTLEHLKRLEGEVLNTLEELGETQSLLELAGVTVDPHQMRGLETNPRAAKIAEAVLWIGYLQWHYRTRGNVNPPEPVLKDFQNIECRDAVLAWDRVEFATDEAGLPITRWDGRTYKRHPVTGEEVPDDTVRTPLERYVNPRKAEWPEADFVVGNPPFLGKGERMRQALGDGYVEALRETYAEVPESADYVMFWWQKAAELTRAEKLRRFGFITTNSLRQTFNRRVLQTHLDAKNPLSLRFAIPDHPWVDAADGAAVRIAMTIAEAGQHEGALLTVTDEQEGEGEGVEVNLNPRNGGFCGFGDWRKCSWRSAFSGKSKHQ